MWAKIIQNDIVAFSNVTVMSEFLLEEWEDRGTEQCLHRRERLNYVFWWPLLPLKAMHLRVSVLPYEFMMMPMVHAASVGHV